jgi:hypothetical protein
MDRLIRQSSIVFTGGLLGALVNSWLVWYLGRQGVPGHLGIAIAPAWSKMFIYSRLVWGGLWGLLFLLPIWRSGFWVGVFSRGLFFSLGPSLFQLLYVFPVLHHRAVLGLDLGSLTPLYVVLMNAVWGVSAALWVHSAGQ